MRKPTAPPTAVFLAGAVLLVVGLERIVNASLQRGTTYAGARLVVGLVCTLIGSLLAATRAILARSGGWAGWLRRSRARIRK